LETPAGSALRPPPQIRPGPTGHPGLVVALFFGPPGFFSPLCRLGIYAGAPRSWPASPPLRRTESWTAPNNGNPTGTEAAPGLARSFRETEIPRNPGPWQLQEFQVFFLAPAGGPPPVSFPPGGMAVRRGPLFTRNAPKFFPRRSPPALRGAGGDHKIARSSPRPERKKKGSHVENSPLTPLTARPPTLPYVGLRPRGGPGLFRHPPPPLGKRKLHRNGPLPAIQPGEPT